MGGGGWSRNLDWTPVDSAKSGSQDLVTPGQEREATSQSINLQFATDLECQHDIEITTLGSKLFAKPYALLSKRSREYSLAITLGSRLPRNMFSGTRLLWVVLCLGQVLLVPRRAH